MQISLYANLSPLEQLLKCSSNLILNQLCCILSLKQYIAIYINKHINTQRTNGCVIDQNIILL